ncbi:MAG: alpha/beta fold hydrolase [Akkermansiaceae bacterium]|nr:alpha/beta fold hydrolase [Akkermansiaceae bacterium]
MRHLLYSLLGGLSFASSSCAEQVASTQIPPTPRVVLVHGFLETGSNFNTLKKRLEKRGFECYAPKLLHNDGRGGLENLAIHLKRDIDQKFGDKEPISIVAFSMGGLVSRYYLQNLGGAKRCKNFITVASPHNGTKAAWLYPSKGVKQMRSGSEFLANLDLTESQLSDIPVTSYRTRWDLIILPSTSSIWSRAENLEHPSLLHPLLLHSNHVLKDVEKRLLD